MRLSRLRRGIGMGWLVCLLAACSALASPSGAAPATLPPSPTVPAAVLPDETASPGPQVCRPTLDDGVSPSYRPGAPERAVVGHGHIMRGTVRSSRGCAPVAGAVIEIWPEYEGVGHADEARATLVADENGNYSYECNMPEHIHMRISAQGYRTIGSNSYHPDGEAEGRLDLVLAPDEGQ